jgi:Peptidase family M28/PDZ domain
VVARWAAAPDGQKLPGVIVVAAHYDGVGSRSPGADDDASGTAALLQVGRSIGERKPVVRRDVLLVGLSGEEQGAAGAVAFVHHPPGGVAAKDVVAMIDLDMVGRLRDDTLQIFGTDTAGEWSDMLSGACATAHVACFPATGGGAGGEDLRPFFEARIPAVHLFTGVHADRGNPSDSVDRLNAAGMAQVAVVAEHVAVDAADLGDRIAFREGASAPGEGDSRGFGASLGTIPDLSGPPPGQKGMLLAGVRPGGPADQAGLRRGDVLVRLGKHVVGGIDDVKFVMTQSKPGARVKVVVRRDGKELSLEVTLDAPPKR